MLRLQLALAPEEVAALPLLTLENQQNNKTRNITASHASPQLLAEPPSGSLLFSCLLHTHLC